MVVLEHEELVTLDARRERMLDDVERRIGLRMVERHDGRVVGSAYESEFGGLRRRLGDMLVHQRGRSRLVSGTTFCTPDREHREQGTIRPRIVGAGGSGRNAV